MDNPYLFLSTFIVFCPVIGALILAFFPRGSKDAMRFFTLGVTIAVFLTTLWMALPGQNERQFDVAAQSMQNVFSSSWIPSFNIYYFMGLDGISFPLVALTAFISVLAMAASWPIDKYVKAYCILFLILETGMLGVFMALDFFLFYVFWEVMLLPMYFLIGVWGGPRKEYAAIKFFLYTLVGGVLMLIAILMLYFSSDLRTLVDEQFPDRGGRFVASLHLHQDVQRRLGYATTSPSDDRSRARIAFLRSAGQESLQIKFTPGSEGETTASYDESSGTVTVTLAREKDTAAEVINAINQAEVPVKAASTEDSGGQATVLPEDSLTMEAFGAETEIHTFNLLALAEMGQRTKLFDTPLLFGWSLQHWAFSLLLIGFIIKVPSVPFHTWLPDAHVEAPTPISMILAGVLLKMGGYGIIRICYPICPHAGYDLAWIVCLIGVVSMVYGAFAALAQRDFKRMVAYSSVSHMGYVVLGLGVWSATAGNMFNPDYWNMGVKGAMFQMIGHGISSAGMFFLVGVVYDRVHHRNLDKFGGLFEKMPVYTALSIGIFFAALGLPGLCGFIGEVFVVLSVWRFDHWLAVISASVVILTAAYILWAIQRVYLGAEYHGPHEEALTPMTVREKSIAIPLFALAIWFGVYPQVVLNYMDNTIDQQVQQLADWTREVKEPAIARQMAEVEPEPQATGGSAAVSAPPPPPWWVATADRPHEASRATVPNETAPVVGPAHVKQRGR